MLLDHLAKLSKFPAISFKKMNSVNFWEYILFIRVCSSWPQELLLRTSGQGCPNSAVSFQKSHKRHLVLQPYGTTVIQRPIISVPVVFESFVLGSPRAKWKARHLSPACAAKASGTLPPSSGAEHGQEAPRLHVPPVSFAFPELEAGGRGFAELRRGVWLSRAPACVGVRSLDPDEEKRCAPDITAQPTGLTFTRGFKDRRVAQHKCGSISRSRCPIKTSLGRRIF